MAQFNELDIQQLLDKQDLICFQYDHGCSSQIISRMQLKCLDLSEVEIQVTQSMEDGQYTWSKIVCCICSNNIDDLRQQQSNIKLFGCCHFLCNDCFDGYTSRLFSCCPICKLEFNLVLELKYRNTKTVFNDDGQSQQSQTYQIISYTANISNVQDKCYRQGCTNQAVFLCQLCRKPQTALCKKCLNTYEIECRSLEKYFMICQNCTVSKCNIEWQTNSAVSSELASFVKEATSQMRLVRIRQQQQLEELRNKYGDNFCRIHLQGYSNFKNYRQHMCKHHPLFSYLKKLCKFFCQKCYRFANQRHPEFSQHQADCKKLNNSQKYKRVIEQLQQ